MQKVILCVDDEKSILWGLQQQIKRGFQNQYLIELAESGEEALEIIREFQESEKEITLLITDEMMPGIKGHQLIKEMNANSPQTKCILLSGYTAEEVLVLVQDTNLYKHMKKPWDYDELIEAIKGLANENG